MKDLLQQMWGKKIVKVGVFTLLFAFISVITGTVMITIKVYSFIDNLNDTIAEVKRQDMEQNERAFSIIKDMQITDKNHKRNIDKCLLRLHLPYTEVGEPEIIIVRDTTN